jgi:hypothetical protein
MNWNDSIHDRNRGTRHPGPHELKPYALNGLPLHDAAPNELSVPAIAAINAG